MALQLQMCHSCVDTIIISSLAHMIESTQYQNHNDCPTSLASVVPRDFDVYDFASYLHVDFECFKLVLWLT